jgi:hypothetical protein
VPHREDNRIHAFALMLCFVQARDRSGLTGLSLDDGIIFTPASGPIAPRPMEQSELCRWDVRMLALPDFQGRLLKGTTERKR